MIFEVGSILAVYIVSGSVIQYLIVCTLNTELPQIHNFRIGVQCGDKFECHLRICAVACDTSIIEADVCCGDSTLYVVSKVHCIALSSV